MSGLNDEGARIEWLEQRLADVPADDHWLAAAEVSELDRLRVPKRRSEWRLGRWTAKLAAATVTGVDLTPASFGRFEVRRLPSGAPQIFHRGLPVDFTISLTHRAGRAACAVSSSCAALGCDLEVAEPRSDAFVRDYFCDSEQSWLASAVGRGNLWVATLMWSAKESTLKALGIGLTMDTRELLVTVGDCHADPGGDSNWRPIWVESKEQIFSGWWQHSQGLLRTVVASPAPSIPQVCRATVPAG